MLIRPATEADGRFLLRVLAHAADWRPEQRVRSADQVLADPAVSRYAADWPRPGDVGVVAQTDAGTAVGAAWWRFLPAAAPGYGFVDADVPEVTLGVLPVHRRQGLGRRLMEELILAAEARSLPALSLSVERDNHALDLYLELGFVEVGGNPDAPTLLLPLHRSRP